MLHISSSSVRSLLGNFAVLLCTLLLTAHARPISNATHPTSSSMYATNNSELTSCRTIVSSNVIAKFRYELKDKPHPLFLIAEMADLLHSELYYERNFHNCTLNHDVLEDTIMLVNKTIIRYLNNSGVLSENHVGCPPSYNLTYHAERYPRYQIEVLCTRQSLHIRSDSGQSCRPYHMGEVHYLTKEQCSKGMRSGNVTDDVSREEWNECKLGGIGVGCRFDGWCYISSSNRHNFHLLLFVLLNFLWTFIYISLTFFMHYIKFVNL